MVRRDRPPPPIRTGTVIALVLAGSTLMAGCGSASDAGPGSRSGSPELTGRAFISTEVRGHTLVDGTTVRLSFDEDAISAQAGCNTIFGEASWADSVLTTTRPLAMSMMACDEDLTAQDQWLADFLVSEPSVALDGDTLVLGDDTEGITLTEE